MLYQLVFCMAFLAVAQAMPWPVVTVIWGLVLCYLGAKLVRSMLRSSWDALKPVQKAPLSPSAQHLVDLVMFRKIK